MFLILLFILIFSFSLLFKRQKEEKGKKRSKDEIRQNKEIPTFLMAAAVKEGKDIVGISELGRRLGCKVSGEVRVFCSGFYVLLLLVRLCACGAV